MRNYLLALLVNTALFSPMLIAGDLKITDAEGKPLAQVMVTRTPTQVPVGDLSDDGYTPHGVTNRSATTLTRFTDADGQVSFDHEAGQYTYRARAQGYTDIYFDTPEGVKALQPMTDEEYIASFPSNVWLSELEFGGDETLKKSFQLNCAFCHQQASPFMRNERTPEQWVSVIERMNTY
ncbi:MAG: carboxypeptidase-like regulatory domain-containing protein, partial [Pseudomonadota bacterium]